MNSKWHSLSRGGEVIPDLDMNALVSKSLVANKKLRRRICPFLIELPVFYDTYSVHAHPNFDF